MRLKSRTFTAMAVAITGAIQAGAQMPGAPVFQNAWAAPGIVVALDIAGGSNGSVYAGAAGWAPSRGRFQLSGGAGMQASQGAGSRAVYGARVAVPVMQLMGGKVGIAAFGGIGGGAGSATDSLRSNTVVPGGVAIGYRQSIGSGGRGFSVFADPGYQYHSGTTGSQGYLRVGYGIDAGISSRFGLTIGGESGGIAGSGKAGPTGSLYGVGVSMKLGR